MSEFSTQFKKERSEHPTLPDSAVKTIVSDHMKDEHESPCQFAYKKLKENMRW